MNRMWGMRQKGVKDGSNINFLKKQFSLLTILWTRSLAWAQ